MRLKWNLLPIIDGEGYVLWALAQIVETNIRSIHAGPFKKGACVHIYVEIVEAITRCHHYWHLKQSLCGPG